MVTRSRLVAVHHGDQLVYLEAVPLLAVVDEDNRPIRWSTGELWTTTDLSEAMAKAEQANFRELGGPDVPRPRFHPVVLR